MAGNGRKKTPAVAVAVEEIKDDSTELVRCGLRERWELASVLNFLNVFEPIIQSKLKISAEEIEMALIKPNDSLAQLHITLLKGIPPVTKTLNDSDGWVTALCKKLAMWWPWVAEGDLPLTVAKGEEISRYKELDPTIRLMMLKALCEIRADQDDTVSYINDALKSKAELSTFRKDKICGNENGTAYWFDGNAIIGHRLYKEVDKFDSKAKVKGKGSVTPTINCQWETLATNLEEFRKVADEFSSSKVKLEVAVSKTIETDFIPILEKLQKKKEKAIRQRQRQEMLLSGFRNPGIARSSRNRKPVNYTFEDYDKAIHEAIQQTNERKSIEDHRPVERRTQHKKVDATAPQEGSDSDIKSRDSEATESNSESESERLQVDDVDGHNDNENVDKMDGTSDEEENDDKVDDTSEEEENDDKMDYIVDGEENDDKVDDTCDKENNNLGDRNYANFVNTHKGSRRSKKGVGSPVSKLRDQGAKNRLRQRPTRNTALDSVVAPDSEDESAPENASNRSRSSNNLSQASDPDDDDSSSSSSSSSSE